MAGKKGKNEPTETPPAPVVDGSGNDAGAPPPVVETPAAEATSGEAPTVAADSVQEPVVQPSGDSDSPAATASEPASAPAVDPLYDPSTPPDATGRHRWDTELKKWVKRKGRLPGTKLNGGKVTDAPPGPTPGPPKTAPPTDSKKPPPASAADRGNKWAAKRRQMAETAATVEPIMGAVLDAINAVYKKKFDIDLNTIGVACARIGPDGSLVPWRGSVRDAFARSGAELAGYFGDEWMTHPLVAPSAALAIGMFAVVQYTGAVTEQRRKHSQDGHSPPDPAARPEQASVTVINADGQRVA